MSLEDRTDAEFIEVNGQPVVDSPVDGDYEGFDDFLEAFDDDDDDGWDDDDDYEDDYDYFNEYDQYDMPEDY